jgi:uncharacterized protein (DUF697 family)
MLARFNLANVWRNIRELDLQRIRDAAETPVRIVVAGTEPERMGALAANLRRDPRRPDDIANTLIPLVETGAALGSSQADVILLVFSDAHEHRETQAAALSTWSTAGIPVIPVIAPGAAIGDAAVLPLAAGSMPVFASTDDWGALQAELAPAILKILPDQILSLGRHYPMLRETAARRLIGDTSTANAAYSFSTGLAEIIPVLDIPLNVADMIVLTKAQAMLVYKLGLALGLSPDWQYYITEFSGVIGSGFLWRQVARSLVGLIPAWGIVPKVAVAYSGTYAVGQAVLHWYLTGRHATRRMLGAFSREALSRGKAIGQAFRRRLPGRKREALPAGEIVSMEASPEARICTQCSTVNDEDARFCKNCGSGL